MISLKELLTEVMRGDTHNTEESNIDEASTVATDAKAKGLTYMRFGRWGKDGKVTHKTVDGKLQPVSNKSAADMWKPRTKGLKKRPVHVVKAELKKLEREMEILPGRTRAIQRLLKKGGGRAPGGSKNVRTTKDLEKELRQNLQALKDIPLQIRGLKQDLKNRGVKD